MTKSGPVGQQGTPELIMGLALVENCPQLSSGRYCHETAVSTWTVCAAEVMSIFRQSVDGLCTRNAISQSLLCAPFHDDRNGHDQVVVLEHQ